MMHKQVITIIIIVISAGLISLALFDSKEDKQPFYIATADTMAEDAKTIAISLSSDDIIERKETAEKVGAIKRIWMDFYIPSDSELAYYAGHSAQETIMLLQSYRLRGDITAPLYISKVIERCRSFESANKQLGDEAKKASIPAEALISRKLSGYRSLHFQSTESYCSHISSDVQLTRETVNELLSESAKSKVEAALFLTAKLDDIPETFLQEEAKNGKLLESDRLAIHRAQFVRSPEAALGMAFELVLAGNSNAAPLVAELIIAGCSSHIDCSLSNSKEILWICSIYLNGDCSEESDFISIATRVSLLNDASGKREPDADIFSNAIELARGISTDYSYLQKRTLETFTKFRGGH